MGFAAERPREKALPAQVVRRKLAEQVCRVKPGVAFHRTVLNNLAGVGDSAASRWWQEWIKAGWITKEGNRNAPCKLTVGGRKRLQVEG